MTLTLNIKQKTTKTTKRVVVEMDADRLEKMAAAFEMFNPDFLNSVERAEADYRAGRVRRISSLRTLAR